MTAQNQDIPMNKLMSEESGDFVISHVLEGKDMSKIFTQLTADNLFSKSHKIIFTTVRNMWSNDIPVDPIGVTNKLETMGLLKQCGGASGVMESYIKYAGVNALLDHHIHIVKESSIMRDVVRKSQQLLALNGEDYAEIKQNSLSIISEITDLFSSNRSTLSEMPQIVNSMMKSIEERIDNERNYGIPTGLEALDAATGGMIPGFILIGGQTSRGKSALAKTLLEAATVNHGATSVVFSMEMEAELWAERILTSLSNIPFREIRSGQFANYNRTKFVEGCTKMRELPIYIDDRSDITIEEVRLKAREIHAKKPLSLVVVDYIQLMDVDLKRFSRHEQAIGNIGSHLKKMSRELKCCVLGLTQLNDDGKVRESRALTHHCDNYYVIQDDGLYIAKNRNGQRDVTLPIFLDGQYVRFVEGQEPVIKQVQKQGQKQDRNYEFPKPTRQKITA